MLESTRLDYLAAMGVVNWVPRHPLAHAGYRIPALLPEIAVEQTETAPTVTTPKQVAKKVPAGNPARAVEAVRAQINPRQNKSAATQAVAKEQANSPSIVEPVVEAPPLEPFYLQLWLAGPCALLIETPEPGLESACPGMRLLKDILRAVQLPPVPRLHSDFRWPLNRNPQFDRSALTASLALQAFMQGRLESEAVVSIGCFGKHSKLLFGSDLDKWDSTAGAEQALEHLPAAWFAPDLESLMSDARSKAQLWQQLKRIMRRWQAEQ